MAAGVKTAAIVNYENVPNASGCAAQFGEEGSEAEGESWRRSPGFIVLATEGRQTSETSCRNKSQRSLRKVTAPKPAAVKLRP